MILPTFFFGGGGGGVRYWESLDRSKQIRVGASHGSGFASENAGPRV